MITYTAPVEHLGDGRCFVFVSDSNVVFTGVVEVLQPSFACIRFAGHDSGVSFSRAAEDTEYVYRDASMDKESE